MPSPLPWSFFSSFTVAISLYGSREAFPGIFNYIRLTVVGLPFRNGQIVAVAHGFDVAVAVAGEEDSVDILSHTHIA